MKGALLKIKCRIHVTILNFVLKLLIRHADKLSTVLIPDKKPSCHKTTLTKKTSESVHSLAYHRFFPTRLLARLVAITIKAVIKSLVETITEI